MAHHAFKASRFLKPARDREPGLPSPPAAGDTLLEREQRYRGIFMRGLDGIVILDPATTRPLEFNDQVCRQLGYTREEFAALTLADIEAVEDPAAIARRVRDVLATGSADFETRHRTRSGGIRDVHVTAQYIEAGGTGTYHCVWRDITARKRAEAALRETNQRLELAITSASLGVWDRNLEDDTETWNDRMYEMYGLEPQSRHPDFAFWCENILHPEDRPATREAIRAALAGTAPYEFEFRAVRPDGHLRYITTTGRVLRDAIGRAVRIIGINRDQTREREAAAERLRLEMQLLHSQKMESLGVLAGGVAHDINNVLAAILGLASVHLGAQPDGTPLHTALETISKAAERGGKLVKNLLAFARQDPALETPVDVNALLREQAGLLERTTLARVRLDLRLEPGLGPTLGDPGALANAFMNLCVNAVDAIADQGTLTLRTRAVDAEWIEVAVEDTGAGMPREVLARAMDPFFTTKEVGKGTGLGLSMVYSTVKAHQGRLEIHSEPGRGTQVTVRLPRCHEVGRTEPPREPAGAPAAREGRLVLVVDDDDLIQASMREVLRVMGHRAEEACQGEEALARLEAGLQPDLVILDMNMPGLGGAGTLPRLRALRPALPVLLSTGRADPAAQALAAAHPRVTLVSKPFGLKELRQHFEDFGLG